MLTIYLDMRVKSLLRAMRYYMQCDTTCKACCQQRDAIVKSGASCWYVLGVPFCSDSKDAIYACL